MKNIATALVKAQKAFNPALKQSINPHFKSRYVDLAGCVEAVIDALNDNGIFLLQKTFECADMKRFGAREKIVKIRNQYQNWESKLVFKWR